MTTHLQVVVDIEARAKTDNGIITRIAVCPFRFDEGVLSYEELLNRTLYLSIDQQEQIDMGRVTDEMTEEWWAKQTEELRKESYYPTDEDISVRKMFEECKRFLNRWNYNHYESFLWARNSGYEYGKLTSMNSMVYPGEKEIFNHWNWHECKTYNYILSGGETQKWMPENIDDLGFQEHNASHDASMDALRLLTLWHKQ